jgi:ABC-type ATPase with predicted acetyltransferase domain
MMGRQRLEQLREHGQELVADGHAEGHELLELIAELDRLRSREWTPVRLCDALDTIVALYVSEPEGRSRGLGDTSLLELIEWSGRSLRPEGENRERLAALNQKLRTFLEAMGLREASS